MAVERLKTCDNIVALSKELGVHRRLLYKWRDQFAPFDETAEPATGTSPQTTLRRTVHQLQRLLVDKTLEVDFFKGACEKSRLDASGPDALAGRRLRPNPSDDAIARRPQYRAYVSARAGESRRVLSVSPGPRAR